MKIHSKNIENTNNLIFDVIVFKPKLKFEIDKCHKPKICCDRLEAIRLPPSMFRRNLNRPKYSAKQTGLNLNVSTTQWFENPTIPNAVITFAEGSNGASIEIKPPFFVRMFLLISSRVAILIAAVTIFDKSPNVYIYCFVVIYLLALYAEILFSFLSKAKELKKDIIDSIMKSKGEVGLEN